MLKSTLYKDLYDAEWSRREYLGTALGVSIGILTLLGSALVVLAQKVDYAQYPTGGLAAIFGGGAILTFGWAVGLLVRSYHGYVYRRIPFPEELREYEEELYRRHRAVGNADIHAEADMEALLRDRYAEAADRNSRNNSIRGEFLFQANRWIVWTLLLTTLAGIFSVFNIRSQSPQPLHVEVVHERSLR